MVFKKVQDFIKPNSIVLDLGANFGQMSILWSKCKPNVEVYAFEASKYVFNILKKNILVNSANVKPFNVLISNESNKNQLIKKSQLNQYTTYGTNKIETSSSLGNGKGIDTIEALRIDDLNYTEQISVMKIDVQGYDLEALKGSEKTIREHKMPIIFEYEKKFEKEFKYTFKDFEKFIDKINYKIETKIDEINYLILPK